MQPYFFRSPFAVSLIRVASCKCRKQVMSGTGHLSGKTVHLNFLSPHYPPNKPIRKWHRFRIFRDHEGYKEISSRTRFLDFCLSDPVEPGLPWKPSQSVSAFPSRSRLVPRLWLGKVDQPFDAGGVCSFLGKAPPGSLWIVRHFVPNISTYKTDHKKAQIWLMY